MATTGEHPQYQQGQGFTVAQGFDQAGIVRVSRWEFQQALAAIEALKIEVAEQRKLIVHLQEHLIKLQGHLIKTNERLIGSSGKITMDGHDYTFHQAGAEQTAKTTAAAFLQGGVVL